MIDDLKIIKKKYGEEMMRFCRDNLPTILEKPGKLSTFMLNHFYPSKTLLNDIKKDFKTEDFIRYIMYNLQNDIVENYDTLKSPKDLMKQVGYILKECKTERDIQKYKKYYDNNEVICTITQKNRLDRCHVFFAVKENVKEIKRKNFKNPNRQDEYGTSVISIQFTRDETHNLSIKNRYNHTVEYPDATFSNNLDNIVLGLTESFKKYFGLKQEFRNIDFKLKNYLKIDDKYIKYNNYTNVDKNKYYFCPNNIIIKNKEIIKYDDEKYIFMDNFILNLKDKKLEVIDESFTNDGFYKELQNIEKINLINTENGKKINIKTIKSDIEIILDQNSSIISYYNSNQAELDHFLTNNIKLAKLTLPNLKKINDYALINKSFLKNFQIPDTITEIGEYAFFNTFFGKLELPNSVKIIKKGAFQDSIILSLKLSDNLEEIGEEAFAFNSIKTLICPETLKKIGSRAFHQNNLEYIKFNDNLEIIDSSAFGFNKLLEVTLPQNTIVASDAFAPLVKIERKKSKKM